MRYAGGYSPRNLELTSEASKMKGGRDSGIYLNSETCWLYERSSSFYFYFNLYPYFLESFVMRLTYEPLFPELFILILLNFMVC